MSIIPTSQHTIKEIKWLKQSKFIVRPEVLTSMTITVSVLQSMLQPMLPSMLQAMLPSMLQAMLQVMLQAMLQAMLHFNGSGINES